MLALTLSELAPCLLFLLSMFLLMSSFDEPLTSQVFRKKHSYTYHYSIHAVGDIEWVTQFAFQGQHDESHKDYATCHAQWLRSTYSLVPIAVKRSSSIYDALQVWGINITLTLIQTNVCLVTWTHPQPKHLKLNVDRASRSTLGQARGAYYATIVAT